MSVLSIQEDTEVPIQRFWYKRMTPVIWRLANLLNSIWIAKSLRNFREVCLCVSVREDCTDSVDAYASQLRSVITAVCSSRTIVFLCRSSSSFFGLLAGWLRVRLCGHWWFRFFWLFSLTVLIPSRSLRPSSGVLRPSSEVLFPATIGKDELVEDR